MTISAAIVAILLTAFFTAIREHPVAAQGTMPTEIVQKNSAAKGHAEIYLAGGCFWGTEMYLRLLQGVVSVESGYANGNTAHPTYHEVCGGSGHAETVHVVYDPDCLSPQKLLDVYFTSIDPTSHNQQGNDRGLQYRTGIYYTNQPEDVAARDRCAIETSLQKLQENYDVPLAIEFGPIVNFYRAEEEHQEYLLKNPNGYCHIPYYLFDELHKKNVSCHLKKTFDRNTKYEKPDQVELKKQLTELQYAVTQQAATEPPFHNAYNKEFREGIYCDITTGQPLFVSTDKFESGCGWPAFSRPISESVLEKREDRSFDMMRTEVMSKASGAHLGHVFHDGPKKSGGLRYCINSASLRFIPRDEMEANGYGAYLDLFENGTSRIS